MDTTLIGSTESRGHNPYWFSNVGYWELVTSQSVIGQQHLDLYAARKDNIPCQEVLRERQITYRLDIILSRPLAITGNTQVVGYTVVQGGYVGMSACTGNIVRFQHIWLRFY